MSFEDEYKPDFSSLHSLLLDMALERSIDLLLQNIVDRLAQRPHIAMARIWLTQSGDICSQCLMHKKCPDQSYCLHLMASSRSPLSFTNSSPVNDTKRFQRIPIGVDEIGEIASTGKTLECRNLPNDTESIGGSNWVKDEKVTGICGLPLRYKWVVLGVLAVYTRLPLSQEETVWLRMIANHAGISIANTRAFEEIEQLKKQLELENTYLREELDEAKAYGDIVGQSPPLLNVLKQIELVASTNANVLILGDSGTGKELVAREIHKLSLRRDRPMIKVNCASIPRELYESEFFGHVKGAFTGAINDRIGRFEAANGGTLFLDEVGEIPLELQSKLLRVLQEGQYERVGEETTRQVDVRIIASTNKNMLGEVEAKRFRQDLFYRLNVFPIKILPLCKRKEDIPLLATHLVKLIAGKMDRPAPRLTQANLIELQTYDWPGNVRELQNIIERAVITSRSGLLQFDIPKPQYQPLMRPEHSLKKNNHQHILSEMEMRQKEQENILAALTKCNWKIYGDRGASELLGIKPTTLSARIKKMSLKKPI